MTNVSELLLEKGNSFYKKGKMLIKIFLISLALFALILLIALMDWGSCYGLTLVLTFTSYPFVNFLTVVAYLGILIGLVGIPFYFLGLHYMGLGQIGKNTEKKEVISDELPEL